MFTCPKCNSEVDFAGYHVTDEEIKEQYECFNEHCNYVELRDAITQI